MLPPHAANAGMAVCCLVATAVVALAGSAMRPGLKDSRSTNCSILLQAAGALAVGILLYALGLRHHTGQGFWKRLTQQLVQPHDIELLDVAHEWGQQFLSGINELWGFRLAWHLAASTLPLLVFALAALGLCWPKPTQVAVRSSRQVAATQPPSHPAMQWRTCIMLTVPSSFQAAGG